MTPEEMIAFYTKKAKDAKKMAKKIEAEAKKKRRAEDTRQKIAVGGAVLSVIRKLRYPNYDAKKDETINGYEKYDEQMVAAFLLDQETRGHFFSNFANKWHNENDFRLNQEAEAKEKEKAAKAEEKKRQREERKKLETELRPNVFEKTDQHAKEIAEEDYFNEEDNEERYY